MATYKPEGHVLHDSKPNFKSQYISASKSLEAAISNSSKYGTGREKIVRIDLSKVSNVIDLNNTCSNIQGNTARNRARASNEVLIIGTIPPDAITVVR